MDKMISKEDKELQKALQHMLSNKFIQYFFYKCCVEAIKHDERKVIANLFCTIADKKLNEHYESFLKYALDNDIEVPIKFSEREKYADKKIYKNLDTLKKNQDATYYIDRAVQLEEDMIEAANKMIDNDMNSQFSLPYDFMSMVYRNNSDDNDCKNMLKALVDAYKAGADYIVY